MCDCMCVERNVCSMLIRLLIIVLCVCVFVCIRVVYYFPIFHYIHVIKFSCGHRVTYTCSIHGTGPEQAQKENIFPIHYDQYVSSIYVVRHIGQRNERTHTGQYNQMNTNNTQTVTQTE